MSGYDSVSYGKDDLLICPKDVTRQWQKPPFTLQFVPSHAGNAKDVMMMVVTKLWSYAVCVTQLLPSRSRISLCGVVGYINFGSHNTQRHYEVSTANPPGRIPLSDRKPPKVLSPST